MSEVNSVKQNLIKARSLIENELHWVQGDWLDQGPDGQCMCGLGALGVVMYGDDFNPYGAAGHDANVVCSTEAELLKSVVIDKIKAHPKSKYFTGKPTFATFNDFISTTHADVLEAFDKAIELA